MASELCTSLLDIITGLAVVFLGAALVIGVVSAIIALDRPKPGFGSVRAADAQPIAPILEALKGLIEALGSAPAWFALFLAGIFLLWTAGEVYVDACKGPEVKVTRTITESKVTTRTEGARPVAQPNTAQRASKTK